MRTTRRGFTLVELLVVIAIIALLISILAPSLSTVKNLAKETICSTNLRGLGIAIAVYAETNKGWLMATEIGWDPLNSTPSAPNNCHRLYKMDTIQPSTGTNRPHCWAYAYDAGLIQNYNMLYCPSAVWHPLSGYKQPWPRYSDDATDPNHSGNVWSSYSYSPYVAEGNPPKPSGIKTMSMAYPKKDLYPTDKILGIDRYLDSFSHDFGNQAGFNRLYIGGNVNNLRSSAYVKYNTDNFQPLGDWGPVHTQALKKYLEP